MKLATVLGACLTVLAALVVAGVSAQTTTSDAMSTTTTTNPDGTTTTTLAATPKVSASPAATSGTPVVLNVVEITRLVPAGTTAVTAFTVPAGRTLIVTDVLVTNTGAAGTCGAAVNRAAGAAAAVTPPTATTAGVTAATGATSAATAPPTAAVPTLAGTITQSDSSITGPLCVAARTTTPLPFTTGIEFGPGQTVQLINVPDATTAAATAAPDGAVAFHLRGMLVAG